MIKHSETKKNNSQTGLKDPKKTILEVGHSLNYQYLINISRIKARIQVISSKFIYIRYFL